MNKLKKLIAFLKDPNFIFLCAVWLITLCLGACSIVMMVFGVGSWLAYVVFACTAVFFAYAIYTIVRGVPALKAKVVERAKRHAFTNNLITDYGFRTIAFSVFSFVINVGFAVFNAVLGIVASSVWYGILAGYYICLSALRFGLLVGGYKAKKRSADNSALFSEYKLRLYRLCGVALFVLEVALAAAVTMMVLSDRPTAYTEIMAITSAAYTFYKIIFAIINLFKVRRLNDPLLQCFRNINLTDATVSLFSLQVTLVAVFSDESGVAPKSMRTLNAITGFTVCALTIFLGVFMIVRASGKLKNLQQRGDNGEKREG